VKAFSVKLSLWGRSLFNRFQAFRIQHPCPRKTKRLFSQPDQAQLPGSAHLDLSAPGRVDRNASSGGCVAPCVPRVCSDAFPVRCRHDRRDWHAAERLRELVSTSAL